MSLGLSTIRTILIRDDREEIGQELLRYGDGWADVIDTPTLHPDVYREGSGRIVALLAISRRR